MSIWSSGSTACCAWHDAGAGRLCLEITESAIMDPTRALQTLQRLSELGVRLSIDDSAPASPRWPTWKRLPVDEALKIDRSFVMGMGAIWTMRASCARPSAWRTRWG